MNIENILDKAIEILKDYDSSEEMKCFVFNPESQKSIHLRFRIGEQDENLHDTDSKNEGNWQHDCIARMNYFIMVSKNIDRPEKIE